MGRTEYEIREKKKHTNLCKTGVFKRGFALLLAVLMAVSVMTNTGFFYVNAQEEATASQTEDEFLEDVESLEDAESEFGEQSILQEYRILESEEIPEEIEMQASLPSNSGEYKLDDLPFNNKCDVVIDKSNQDQFNNAVLTGEFSDFTDNSGTARKSSWKGIVIDGVTVDLTIRDVTIDRNKSSDDKLESTEAAITLKNGAALNLTLEGSNYLEGATGGAGICVGSGCTLIITKESSGQLKAVGGDYYGAAAGIGANADGKLGNQPGIPQSVGNIIIEGGTIEAIGGTYTMYGYFYTSAAGIGGSFEGTNGNIEINGGTVTAVGGENAAAIGGGMAGWVSSITIAGGTVTATRIGNGAAIGAGYLGQQTGDLSCGDIKITGGNVTTEGNIGYGGVFNESSSRAGSVEIGEAVILKCNGNIDPAPEGVVEYNILFTIQSNGTMVKVSGTTQDITVRCQDRQMYHFYMLAQLGGTISEVVEISFGASLSSEVILKGETQGTMYESFAGALASAEKNPGSTVKLLQDISISETINIGSQASYTIDLNGKTLRAIYNDKVNMEIFSLARNASLTVLDSAGGGKFDGDCKYPNVQKLFSFSYNTQMLIQSGIFSEKAGTINGTAGNLRITGGTFYNEVRVGYFKYVLTGGKFAGTLKAGSTVGNILARGYRYKDLTTGAGVSTEANQAESIQNVEVYVLSSIGGTVTLTGSGIWDENLTAAYTPDAGQSEEEKYIYTWYYEDESGQATKISGTAQSAQPTTSLTSSCRIPVAAANKWIYCKAEAEGNYYSGSICSEKMQVLPKNIENQITHGVIKKYYTGQPVEVTQADLTSKYFRYKGGYYLNLGNEIEIVPDTYRNNTEISTGDSKASVTIRGIGAYTGEYVLKYEIIQKDITAEAEASSLAWTAQDVTISAPDGYTICPKTENGYDYEKGFSESFTVTEESTSSDGTIIFYRLKEETDGAVSAEKQITVKIDRSAPDFSGEGDGIRVENKTWKDLLADISFGFYTKTAEGTINAADGLSGVAEYYYYVDQVSDQAVYAPLSKKTLDKYAEKTSGKFKKAENGKFLLSANKNQVVYAYAIDHAGNQSDYICTDGLVLDTTAPDMQITQPAKEDGTLKDTEATIGVELNEDAVLLFFYQDESRFKYIGKYKEYITAVNDYMLNSDPQYPQFLKNENGKLVPIVSDNEPVFDGGRYKYRWKCIQPVKKDKWYLTNNAVEVVYRAEGKAGANSIIMDGETSGLKQDTNYTVWIAAVDPAGNITEQQIAFKTAKAMPIMAEPPVVSGVYGDTASELSVTKPGVAKYEEEEIKGTWKVTDTGTTLLPMDGSVKCQVTFTPDESYNGKYEVAVFEVTPTLAKYPLVVDVPDLSKVYGEKLPEITCKVPIMTQDGKTQSLIGDDTEESIQESLQLVTEATKDSPAGTYEFTITSDSPKYEVTAEYFDTSTPEGASTPKSKGTLTITKAEGKLEKTIDFKETQEMQYQHGVDKASFRLGVKANHNETALHYKVSDATDGNGEVIADENISDKLLTIAADGTVTLKGAGSANVTVSLPECRNYTAAAETMTVQVNITKGNVTRQQLETAALTYGESLSDLDIIKMVFTDADDNKVIIPGTIKWKSPDMKPDAGSYEAECIFEPYEASDPSWKNNYKPYEGTVTVTVNKAKAKLANTPVPGDVVYKPDRALSEFLLNDMAKTYGCVEDINGNYMAGWWRFKDPEVMMKPLQAGSKSYEIYFEPDSAPAYGNSNYDFSDVKTTVTITVKKAIPYVSVPPATNEYTHGDFLYNQNLTEGTVIYGDGKGGPGSGISGADMSIPGSFTWKAPSTQVSYERSNGAEYEYVFTPDDTTSFETVTGKVAITVNKAEYPPLMPGRTLDVAYSCTKVKNVELPQGWEWDEADREKEPAVGSTVTATAVYRAADAPNYVNTSVSIQITRAACDHAKTEIRNVIKATCVAEGNTGETWCMICKEKLSDGDMIPKDATNHTALDQTVIREATISAEGLLIQECKDCGYSKEITIPKLPDKNDDPGSGEDSDKQNEKPGSGDASDKQDEKPGSDGSQPSGDPVTPAPVSGEEAQVSTLPDDSTEAMADTVKSDKTGEEAEQEQNISDDNHSETENKTQETDRSEQAEEKAVNSDSGHILFNGYFWILIVIIVIVFAAIGVVYVLWRKREEQKKQHPKE